MWARTLTLGSAGKSFSSTGMRVSCHQQLFFFFLSYIFFSFLKPFQKDRLDNRRNWTDSQMFRSPRQSCLLQCYIFSRSPGPLLWTRASPAGLARMLLQLNRERAQAQTRHVGQVSDRCRFAAGRSRRRLLHARQHRRPGHGFSERRERMQGCQVCQVFVPWKGNLNFQFIWYRKRNVFDFDKILKRITTIPCSAFFSNEHKKCGENFIRICFFKDEATLTRATEVLATF